jgi:Holin of 3TMs, for gene-transfer release
MSVEPLDLTADQIVAPTPTFEEKAYDPRPQEDSARRRIAYILLALLGFVLVWSLGYVSFYPMQVEAIAKILQLVLSPLIALVSAATGFYFGSKNK